ncbi:MAG TPA: hypothetical protein VF147_08280, partial [Vicinamibacterales bacterium]
MRSRPVVRELAVFAVFVALAVAMTWPLAVHLDTGVSDAGDPLLVAWTIDWVSHALVHQPLHLYEAPIFHPGILPLAYSENLVAVALITLPLHLTGVPPLAIYNIALILGFALSGYGAYVLGRMVSGSLAGGIAGGIFYAFVSFKFDHLPHLQITFSPWVPLLLAALLAFWRKPGWRQGVLLAAVLVANGLTNVYYLMFGGVAVVFTVAVLAVIRPRSWKFYAALAATGIAALLILYPFLRPYRIVSKHYQFVRSFEEVRNGSARWVNWLVPSRASRVYGDVPPQSLYEGEKQLFPGLLVLFATGYALIAVRRRDPEPFEPSPPMHRVVRWSLNAVIVLGFALTWSTLVSERVEIKAFGHRLLAADSADLPVMVVFAALLLRFHRELRERAARSRFTPDAWAAAIWIIVGILGSLGASSILYIFFYRRFEPFQAMRVAARFAIIAYTGLAAWGALGVAAVLDRRTGWRRHAAAAIILVLFTVEAMPRIRWEYLPRETPPVYAWLARARVAPVVEIPFSGEGVDYRYLLASTQHHVKLVNGTSGFFPNEWWKLRDADSKDEFDRFLTDVESYGTRLMIVHGDFLGSRAPRILDWLRRNVASGRLVFLRRFDNEVSGDYVFAIRRNLKDWQQYRGPDVPDGAGNLPAQNLERFL